MLLSGLALVATLALAPQVPGAPQSPAVPQTPAAPQAPGAAQTPALPPGADSVVIPAGELIRLYTDCSEARWPFGTEERFVPKTTEELDSGVVRRRALEERWRAYFAARAGDSIRPTPREEWRYPLARRERLLRNFRNPREDGLHGALDIFVVREGVRVRSPVSGVIVAAGDGWIGRWDRRAHDLVYEGGGLSRRSGNGAILFDPASGGYFLFSHLQEGIDVRAGDVIAAGANVGRVGHTGNASAPRRGMHLHLAYKEPGTACGIPGVLVAVDPYTWVRAARDREFTPSGARRGTPARQAAPPS